MNLIDSFKPFSERPLLTSTDYTSTVLFPVEKNGTTYKTAIQDIAAYILDNNGTTTSSAVLFTTQDLSGPQKLQARTNIGLGTAATLNTGTAAGNIPVLDSSGLIPSSLIPGGGGTPTSIDGGTPSSTYSSGNSNSIDGGSPSSTY